jgi:NAD(P)H-dependent FMN reductase
MVGRAPRIIAFAGSLRVGSYNKLLAKNLAAGAASFGAEVRHVDLEDFPLPVYNADLFDAAAADPHALFDRGGKVGGAHARDPVPGFLEIKEHFRWADGWLVAMPEHNRTFTGAFHNLVDWLTRLAPGESPLDNFTYKVVGVSSAAYAGGGVSAINDAKRILTGLGCVAIPGADVVTITTRDEMFDEAGVLRDPAHRRAAVRTGKRVAQMAKMLVEASGKG